MNIEGKLSLAQAISIAGTTLSQFGINTRPSSLWARTIHSMLSAITSLDDKEYLIPSCPIASPSHTAIVLNSIGVPPLAKTPSFTALAIVFKCI